MTEDINMEIAQKRLAISSGIIRSLKNAPHLNNLYIQYGRKKSKAKSMKLKMAKR